MRVCINKKTGELIEAQSGGSEESHLEALKENALNIGYKAKDIEVKFITDEEYKKLKEDSFAKPTYKELREREYPTLGDQLDNITKALQYLKENGVDIGPDGIMQVNACVAVKEKYPED